MPVEIFPHMLLIANPGLTHILKKSSHHCYNARWHCFFR